jgi:DNA repair exonuclease SbcCD ATPase subunit
VEDRRRRETALTREVADAPPTAADLATALDQLPAPAQDRLEELRAEITDLERRIERQVANLEAEDATPSLRRRVGTRIAELEDALEERRQHANALAAQSADAPPTVADLATALDRLPLLAERLQDLPHAELRALFDSLQLQIAFQPQTRTIDVEVTLVADEPPDRDGETSQVWSVPPGGLGPDLRRLVRLRHRVRLRLERSH